MEIQAFLTLALPVLAGLAAVGSVLYIKIHRRSQLPARRGIGVAVPSHPLAPGQAHRWWRAYARGAGVLGVLLAAWAAWILYVAPG